MQADPRIESTGFASFLRHVVRWLVFTALRIVYRVRVVGRIPTDDDSGALILSNHVSFVDAMLLGASAGPRWVRFVILREFLEHPIIGPLVRFFDVVPVSSTRAKEALKTTIAALRGGSLVCLFPEGQLTRHGLLNPLKKGFELMARGAGAPVVPVWLDNVWGSIFSFERGRFFRKRPHRIPYHLAIHFGAAIAPAEATVENVERALRQLSADALGQRAELRSSLDFEVVEALRRDFRRPCLIEGDRVWTCGEVLAVAERLAERWKRLPAIRVRVAHPSGASAALANIGLVLAGKIPHNTKAPAGPDDTVIDAAEIAAAIEASDDLRCRARRAIAWWPVDWCRQRVPACGNAVAVERSVFTHRSLLAQVEQLAGTNLVNHRGRIITTEPLHTVAGTLIGLWFPLLRGFPIEFASEAEPESAGAVSEAGSPTSGGLAGDSGVWLGSGDVPPGFFAVRPGRNCLVLEDVAAVITMSQPDPPLATSTSDPQAGGRPGTLGRFLSGFAHEFDDESRLLVRSPALPHHEHEFLNTGIRARLDAEGLLVRE